MYALYDDPLFSIRCNRFIRTGKPSVNISTVLCVDFYHSSLPPLFGNRIGKVLTLFSIKYLYKICMNLKKNKNNKLSFVFTRTFKDYVVRTCIRLVGVCGEKCPVSCHLLECHYTTYWCYCWQVWNSVSEAFYYKGGFPLN